MPSGDMVDPEQFNQEVADFLDRNNCCPQDKKKLCNLMNSIHVEAKEAFIKE